MVNKEIWRPVREYEGLYEVSNYGRVRSLPRTTTKGMILKLYHNPSNGYVYCCLSKGSKQSSVRVHKIVLEAFTDYVSRKTSDGIDHIDGDKTNNCLWNLEPVSNSENMIRAFALGLEKVEGIKVIDLDTLVVFDSCMDASRSVGGRFGEMVARVCRGERSHYRTHHFAFYEDYINNTIPPFKGKFTKKESRTLWQ